MPSLRLLYVLLLCVTRSTCFAPTLPLQRYFAAWQRPPGLDGGLCKGRRGSVGTEDWQKRRRNSFTSLASSLYETQELDDEGFATTLVAKEEEEEPPLTNFLLQVSFDGRRFTGWSAANDPACKILTKRKQQCQYQDDNKGWVRSVQGVLVQCLAQIYGNVSPARICLEGCSRTDKGVHAVGLVAQVYCLSEHALFVLEEQQEEEQASNDNTTTTNPTNATRMERIENTVPGKRLFHPANATDTTWFTPCRMPLEKLVFALNRMCPDDVRIVRYALPPTPSVDNDDNDQQDDDKWRVFHPTTWTISKTYRYTFSTARLVDPLTRRCTWHVPVSRSNGWNVTAAAQAAQVFQGRHDFDAYCPAPRGATDRTKRRQNAQPGNATTTLTTCTMHTVTLVPVVSNTPFGAANPETLPTTWHLEFCGDRFLYKQVRRMVGAVVAVGQGRVSIDDVQAALVLEPSNSTEHERKPLAFTTAPAHGLVLQSVDYGDHVPVHWLEATN